MHNTANKYSNAHKLLPRKELPLPAQLTRQYPDTAIYDRTGKHISNCSYWDLSQDMMQYLKANGYYFGSLAVARRIAAAANAAKLERSHA